MSHAAVYLSDCINRTHQIHSRTSAAVKSNRICGHSSFQLDYCIEVLNFCILFNKNSNKLHVINIQYTVHTHHRLRRTAHKYTPFIRLEPASYIWKYKHNISMNVAANLTGQWMLLLFVLMYVLFWSHHADTEQYFHLGIIVLCSTNKLSHNTHYYKNKMSSSFHIISIITTINYYLTINYILFLDVHLHSYIEWIGK